MKRAFDPSSQAVRWSWFRRFLIILMMAVSLQAFSSMAYADSLTVTVKQGSNGAPETITCTLLQNNCDLPFTINAGTAAQQSVNVHVAYLKGSIALHFQATGGYFSTADTIGKTVVYTPLWSRKFEGGTTDYTVALFQPLAPTPMMPPAPDANYASVATLEITATSGP